MNRRDSLKALSLLTAGAAILTRSCIESNKEAETLAIASDKLPGVQHWEHERNNALFKERFFTDHEMATITILADIILPKDERSGSASDAKVPDFIEFIVKDLPEHKIPMRGGLKWLDIQSVKLYGQPFIKCSTPEQLALIDAIAYPDQAAANMKQGVAFFSLIRNLTASGFFTSAIGVKDIGYMGNRPGVWNGVPEDVLIEHGFDPKSFFS